MGIIFQIADHINRSANQTDYELEGSAAPYAKKHVIIRGFGVSSVPVIVDGHVLYDTSVAQDGRLLYWKTLIHEPESMEAILNDFEFCKQRHLTENDNQVTKLDHIYVRKQVLKMNR